MIVASATSLSLRRFLNEAKSTSTFLSLVESAKDPLKWWVDNYRTYPTPFQNGTRLFKHFRKSES